MVRKGILREHSSFLLFVFRLLDIFAIVGTALLAHWWILHSFVVVDGYRMALVFGVISGLFFFNQFQLYRPWRGISILVELRVVSTAWAAVLVALAAVLGFAGVMDPPATRWIMTWMAWGWAVLVLQRVAMRLVLRWLRAEGYNQRSVVIVGLSERGLDIAQRIGASTWTGLRLLGYFDARGTPRTAHVPPLPHLGDLHGLAEYVQKNRVDQVWLAYPLRAEERVKQTLHELRHCAVDIRFALDIFAFDLCNHSISEVAGIPILNLSASPMGGTNRLIKAIEDRLLAALILLILSPLMLAIAIGVKRSSPGPVFYRQERVSWNGRSFMMLKFRSMPQNAEQESGPVWNSRDQQRATSFGAFLRRTSLDELPQFINVLLGDMSIVGPRPERPVFVDRFKDEVPDYMKKHLVKAGITGWAQVNGWRGDTDLRKRIEHDLYYIENWSLWFDLRIMAMTAVKGLVHKNAF